MTVSAEIRTNGSSKPIYLDQEFQKVLESAELRATFVQWLRRQWERDAQLANDVSTESRGSVEPVEVVELINAWNAYWDPHLASVIQEQLPGLQVRDTPGIELWELAANRYEFSSFSVDLLRKSRRWWKKFDLDAMIEDRIYADYREALEKERSALVESAREIQGYCNQLISQVEACLRVVTPREEGELQGIGKALNKIIEALNRTHETSGAILQVLEDQKFRVCFYEAIRSLHAHVQDSWGTWSRRVRTPAFYALYALVGVAIVHPIFGFLTGSPAALPLLLLFPLAVFLCMYYLGLAACRQLIDMVVARVAVFNPEPDKSRLGLIAANSSQRSGKALPVLDRLRHVWSEPSLTQHFVHSKSPEALSLHENTVWNPGMSRLMVKDARRPLRVMDLANGSYWLTIVLAGKNGPQSWASLKADAAKSASPAKKEEETLCAIELAETYATEGPGTRGYSGRMGKWLVGIIAAGIVALLIALPLIGDDRRVTVYAMGPDGLCALTEGYVVWPGPGDMLLLKTGGDWNPGGWRWVRISANEISAVEGHSGATQSCDSLAKTKPSAAVSGPINFYQAGATKERAMIVVPFAAEEGASRSGGESAAIACKLGPKQAPLSRALGDMLRRLGDGLKQCGSRAGGPAIIDVRGFSSSVKFDGECAPQSDAKNLELAELRRNRVLHAMFGNGGFSGEYPESWQWKTEGVLIQPNGPKRFTSLAHLEDFTALRDEGTSDRYLTQRAEVWVMSAGGCATRSLLPVR